MRHLVVLLLVALVASIVAGIQVSEAAAGRPCKPKERALPRSTWPVCWTTSGQRLATGDTFLYVNRKGCMAAFGIAADVAYTTFEVRGPLPKKKNRLVDFEKVYDDIYDRCGLQKGRYYRLQVTTWYYDSDYDKEYVESPWIRFKVPLG
jgi:hypothetical protein